MTLSGVGLLAEVSAKNDLRFGISMERWLPEVADFLELDYTAR